MTHALVLGSILGLFSGIVPGPYSGLVAATALHQGFRAGLKLALIPLFSEAVVLAVTAAVISQLPSATFRWMGIAGGLLVLFLAWRSYSEAGNRAHSKVDVGDTRRVGEGVLLGLLSPAPWAFWLLVGSPLFLSAWRQGWAPGLTFFGAFMLFMVGINVGWAGLAALGHSRLSDTAHRRLMVAAAVGLAIAGCVLIWQSWIGNFRSMVEGSQGVVEEVEERANQP
jgi:threonine/homoserine/homoserine lactone efflux protein